MNNIDMYALFSISNFLLQKDVKKVIEISDLIYLHENNNLLSRLFKFFEGVVFRKIDKVIFTSPKFYSDYYNKIYDGNHFILENKPLSNMLPKKLEKKKNDKVIIGIVGLLLQLETYKYLFDFIKNNENYEVHVYGKGIYESEVKRYADQNENIKFFGSYNFFEDVSKIYSSIDIIYMAYSSKSQSLNNKLALPNKLYEAMYFKVPIITTKNTYLGELVKKYSIGYEIDYSNTAELKESIKLISEKKDFLNKNFQNLNENIYLGDNDYKKLLIFLDEK
jgi:glycosyltransferase involved in cell wall biosynthesis